jgi:membrane-associated phospholipid phosphatase
MITRWSDPWRAAWRDRSVRAQFLVTLPALAVLLFALSRFLEYVEERGGVVLQDPLLAWIPPQDLTLLTNTLIYGALFLAIWTLVQQPRQLLLALHAYFLLVVFRIMVMFAAPLDHPQGMILLRDPFVEHLGPARILTRDLFFSGHTATIFLLALAATRLIIRRLLLLSALLVGVCVLWQHVHYTIDVLAAVAFAFCAYGIAVFLHRRDGQREVTLGGEVSKNTHIVNDQSIKAAAHGQHGKSAFPENVK